MFLASGQNKSFDFAELKYTENGHSCRYEVIPVSYWFRNASRFISLKMQIAVFELEALKISTHVLGLPYVKSLMILFTFVDFILR